MAAVSEHPLSAPVHHKKSLTRIAQVTIYVAGAAAGVLGLIVVPADARVVASMHAFAGWLVIGALWTLAVIAARSGVAHGIVWLTAGWGLATTFIAVAQFESHDNGWITAMHVVTSVGSVAWGSMLATRVRWAESRKGF